MPFLNHRFFEELMVHSSPTTLTLDFLNRSPNGKEIVHQYFRWEAKGKRVTEKEGKKSWEE